MRSFVNIQSSDLFLTAKLSLDLKTQPKCERSLFFANSLSWMSSVATPASLSFSFGNFFVLSSERNQTLKSDLSISPADWFSSPRRREGFQASSTMTVVSPFLLSSTILIKSTFLLYQS